MSAAHEMYKKVEAPSGHLESCPCCGADAEVWQFSQTPTSPCTKVVMCVTSQPIGPQSNVNEGCPMYMPDDDHYQATIREAVKYWNEFAIALIALQRANRWKHAKVLRDADDSAQGEQA